MSFTTRRRLHRVRGVAGLAAVAGSFVWVVSGVFLGAANGADGAAPDPQALVAQLGSESFRTREQATQALIELGLPAKEAVKKGVVHADPEISFRCQRILAIMVINERDAMIDAFAADVDGSEGRTLPGWERFQKVVGTTPEARDLFVQMQREEWALLAQVEKDADSVAEKFGDRCGELQLSMRTGVQLSVGAVAAMLFVAGDERVDIPNTAGSSLYSFCHQNQFSQAVTKGEQSENLRKLLGNWILCSEGVWTDYQALMMALKYGMKEGLGPAEAMLRPDVNVPQHYRQYALLGIAQLGDESQLPVVSRWLEDKSVCARQTVRAGTQPVQYQTQIRDVALAATIHLNGEDPKAFGFNRVTPHPTYLYSAPTLGFKDDAERDAAFKKWKAFVTEKKGADEPADDAQK